MKRIHILILSAGALAMVWPMSGAWVGPALANYGSPYPGPQSYGGVTAAEMVSRIGEILAAIDSPQQRSKLAEQWLQFARQTIAKDLELRENWLRFQKQQMGQLQELEQLRLQVAQLQMRVEQLRAQNLQLEQETRLAQAPRPGNSPRPAPPIPSP
jgi:hypothetical protein